MEAKGRRLVDDLWPPFPLSLVIVRELREYWLIVGKVLQLQHPNTRREAKVTDRQATKHTAEFIDKSTLKGAFAIFIFLTLLFSRQFKKQCITWSHRYNSNYIKSICGYYQSHSIELHWRSVTTGITRATPSTSTV